MKEHLYNLIRITLFFTLATVLQACGGSSDKSPKYAISVDTSVVSFANEFLQVSDDTYKVDITFEGNGLLVGFAPDAVPASWLSFRTENVTATSATLYIDVENAENIIPNLYATTLRLSTGDVDKVNLVHHDIDVSLLVWQLITDSEQLSFRGTLGDTTIAPLSLSIASESNEWTAEADVDWLTLDVTEGTGDGVIVVTPNITDFNNAQLYQANITLTETTTGDSKQISVELGLDRHYLFSNQASVSLSKLKNISATSKSLIINSNSPTAINWQASSDVDWLTLTKVGTSGELLVNVKTDSTFTEAQNNAEITINAIDDEGMIDDSVIAETISVSYYQSDEMSENITLDELTANANAIITSPKLPHIYIGTDNQLRVYHQYSGALLTTIDISPAETLLEQLIIHPDGTRLLAKADETIVAEDETTSTVTHRYQINLSDYSVTEITEASIEYEPIQFVSFSGRHFVVTQALEFADENLQRIFWDGQNAYFTNQVDQARNSQAFYALDVSDSSFKRYTAKINDFTTQSIVVEQSHQYRPELLAENQAVNRFMVDDNETGIYAISPTSEWISFDGETFTDNGLLPQAEDSVTLALSKSHNNRAHFARFTQTTGFFIDIYDEEQALINTLATQGQQPTDIALSYDDKRVVLNTSNANQIEIINLEQIQLSTNSLAFEATFGDSNITSQDILISGVSDLWQAQASEDWLVVTTSEVDSQTILTVSIDENNLSGWGVFTGTITVTDPQSNSASIIAVEIAIDEVRLYSSFPALAFSAHADKSTLSHTVDILTNKASNVKWQAQTDVNWLILTPDTDNNTLTVTADPTMLTDAGLYTASITLSSQTPGESIDGQITVNLSKGDFNTSEFDELVIENIDPNSNGVVLDTLRPYLYVAQADNIDVYNIIDGSKATSIQSPLADVDLTNLVIHPDGSLLLASNIETYLDENEEEQTRTNYYQINLADFSISQLDSDAIDIQYSPSKIINVSGKSVVVTEALEFADLSLTRQFWDSENAYLTATFADIPTSNTFISYNATEFNLQHLSLAYNAFTDSPLTITNTLDYINPAHSNGISGVATSTDGRNIYTVNSTSEWSTNDNGEFAEQGLLDGNTLTSPVAVITDSQNNSYFYRFDFSIGFFTLSKYDENQSTIWATGYTAGSADIYLSADYQRVIHYNDTDKKLVIDFMPD
ncbi:BACON domain-containing carbohydrate-binding protein [Colwellia sp. 1_MG-2023]|uniref:BACON domain-containing protein n=1 Tax=Colwellia sp. 1_MG-2023 TaxID=3062649 RepID=UPI0026E30092|nr:BACON domain-containing carbohydrate-binding protein [Colwellia sp. 1_MG-2023]MDO6444151.1 BACON domain-containing carbohydrate-binding protein [Colwellia sp. 1_MG-2023]